MAGVQQIMPTVLLSSLVDILYSWIRKEGLNSHLNFLHG